METWFRWKGKYLYFTYWSLKALWHNKSRFITSRVKSVWDFNALVLLHSFLKKQRQSVQINNNFNSARKDWCWCFSGFHWWTTFLNLFPYDNVLFLTDTFLSNFTENSNLYHIGRDRDKIQKLFRKYFRAINEWFLEYYMELN